MTDTTDLVTMSWGGFRCRLEGFADPMEALAAALPWLAGARPGEGLGPVSSKGMPVGMRRELRNGALVLSPAGSAAFGVDDHASPHGPPLPGLAAEPLVAAEREAALSPASTLELIRMGLGPDPDGTQATEAPDAEAPAVAPSSHLSDRGGDPVTPRRRHPAPARPSDDARAAVLGMIRDQPAPEAEAAQPAARPRRVVRRPPGLALSA